MKKSIYESSVSVIIVHNFDCISPESQQKLSHIPVEISGILLETTRIPPLLSLGLHALLHPTMFPYFHSDSCKSLGDYFLSLHDLKETACIFIQYVKISCNHKVSPSFTIIISYS